MSGLTRPQHDVLLRPIKRHRVSKNPDGQSHVEAYEIRAHLNRVFGFGEWSEDVIDLTMLYEQSKEEGNSVRWRAAYRATVRLTIHATRATYTEAAVGTNWGWLPDTKRDGTHDFAIKTAASQALKRCAMNLGDQFGLSLYNKGSVEALVGAALIVPDGNPDRAVDVDAHITAPLAPETPAPQAEPLAPVAAPAGQDTDWADIIRRRVVKEAPAKTGTTRKTFLLKQLTEAATHNVTGSMVNVDGEALTVERLIQNALRAA